MNLQISVNEFEIIKDGVIIAESNDVVSFKFEDLTFNFRIIENNVQDKQLPEISTEKKTLTLPIYIQWDSINTTFSNKIVLAQYSESSTKKELSVSYAISGLKGNDLKSYIFRYTLFSKNIE